MLCHAMFCHALLCHVVFCYVLSCCVLLCSPLFGSVTLVEGAGGRDSQGYSVGLGIWRPRYAGWASWEVCSGNQTLPTCRVGNNSVMFCSGMYCHDLSCSVLRCYVLLWSVMLSYVMPCSAQFCHARRRRRRRDSRGHPVDLWIWRPRYAVWAGRKVCS